MFLSGYLEKTTKKNKVLSTLSKQITITLIVIISSLNNKRHLKKKTHGQNAASLNFKDPTKVCYVV